MDFLSEQLVAHTQIGHQGFQSLRLFVLDIGLSGLQVRFAAGQELLPPAGERCGGDPQLARERFDIFPAQKPEDCCGLALRRPPTPTVPPLCLAPDFLDTELSVFMQRLQVQEAAGEPGLA